MQNTNSVSNPLEDKNNIPAENQLEENEIEKLGKEDPDEAVHLEKQTISDENKEQDPDDAVHKTITPTIVSEDINKQIDADDAVHGK